MSDKIYNIRIKILYVKLQRQGLLCLFAFILYSLTLTTIFAAEDNIWKRHIGSGYGVDPRFLDSLLQINDGGFLITGHSNLGGQVATSIHKTDKLGNSEWEIGFSGGAMHTWYFLNSVFLEDNGDIIVIMHENTKGYEFPLLNYLVFNRINQDGEIVDYYSQYYYFGEVFEYSFVDNGNVYEVIVHEGYVTLEKWFQGNMVYEKEYRDNSYLVVDDVNYTISYELTGYDKFDIFFNAEHERVIWDAREGFNHPTYGEPFEFLE